MIKNNNLNKILIEIITNVAKKHEDILFIENFFKKNNNNWSELSLSHGLPSLIILYNNLEELFPNHAWEIKSLNLIKYMQKYINNYLNDISLFGGITGIAMSIYHASKKGLRYKILLDKLDNIIIHKVNNICKI